MNALMKFLHIAAAIVWLGGIVFMLFALRPAAAQLAPPQRLPLPASVRSMPTVQLAHSSAGPR